MKEQLMVIADTLDSAKEDWTCSFQIKKEIGEHIYRISIVRQGSKLELTAKLPVNVEDENHSEWSGKVREANENLDCGTFSLCDNGRAVCYRVYSLYTHTDEVKDEETIWMLLNSCYSAIETHGEAMLTQKRKKGLVEGFFDLLGLVGKEADDTEE